MIALKLTQTTNDGRVKVWKMVQAKHPITFGTSRKADLTSIDSGIEPFHFVFEKVEEKWHCINFDSKTEMADVEIENNFEITLKNSKLQFEVIAKKPFVLNQLNRFTSNGNLFKNLVVVTKNNQIISTNVLNSDQSFQFYHQGQLIKLNVNESDTNWTVKELNGFLIQNKKVQLNSTHELEKIHVNEVLGKESKKASLISVGLTLFLVGVSFLAPKQLENTEVKKVFTSSSVIKLDNKRKKLLETKTTVAKSQTTPEPSAAGGKASALLKGAIGARISQLLGKVSATEARTQNIILTTKGIKAGQEPSGRALAAVGNTESSGRNWTGESAGKGTGVSTAGIGGGHGTGNLKGGLGQGKTGSGGVGLIEEESEITGGLDREVIAQYIKTQLGQILYCYERQLSASPDLFGKIAVRFTIAGTGSVETQTINDTTLKNRSVENCILNKVAKWKFPEPKGGTKVLVTYPFLFKSTN
ncbi:MAG: AgmX/PglI C-terminal domain-containing protein [Pseudobdellovibrio sp.]